MQILQAKRETERQREECSKRDGKIANRDRTPARPFFSRLSTNKSSCVEDTAHVHQAAKKEREASVPTREVLGHHREGVHFFNMTRQESVDDDVCVFDKQNKVLAQILDFCHLVATFLRTHRA